MKKVFLLIILTIMAAGQIWSQCKLEYDLSVSSDTVQVGDIIVFSYNAPNETFNNPDIYETSQNPYFEKISNTEFRAIRAGKTIFHYSANGQWCVDSENNQEGCGPGCISGDSPVITIMEDSSSEPLCGDINNGGKVDIIDSLMVAQYYVGLIQSFVAPRGADVNNDGVINIVDALLIAQYYVGANVILDCGYQKEETVTISHIGGIQCEITYFSTIDEATDHLRSAGINVLSMKANYMMVIALCGVGNGTTFIATINRKDLDKAWALGWN